MKMHNDLLARILEYAEKYADDGETRCFPSIPCYTAKEVNYHLLLCQEAGFLEAEEIGDRLSIIRLTYDGQMKLRTFRENPTWGRIGLK